MHTMHHRTDQPAHRALQLHMRPVLRQAGGNDAAGQGQSSGNACGDSTVQAVATTRRDSWFAERAFLGMPLSDDELVHGVRMGIISSSLFINESSHGTYRVGEA